TFQSGEFYVVGKVKAEALQFLKVGDPFLLLRKSADGLETTSARLIVHQPPELAKEVVQFRITDYVGDEMRHLSQVAQRQDVQGMKGYTIKSALSMEGFGDFDLQATVPVIHRLLDDLARNFEV